MFRLKATIIATTLMRPWRTGWSMDRGVDMSCAPIASPVVVALPPRPDPALVEPASFIDADWGLPADAGVVRTFISTAAARADTGGPVEEPADTAEAPGLRAWWSLAGKPSRT